MRSRNIKPGFYKNEKLVECSIAARFLAPGLWMLADREGRLLDRPKQIKMEIFPADSIEVDSLLSELHTHGHILRYEIDGIKYIQILGFSEHQSPHFSEKDSLIPKPFPENTSFKSKNSESSNQKTLPSRAKIPLAQLPDSLIPDLLNPEYSPIGERAREKISRMVFDIIPPEWKEWAIHEKCWDESIVADVWSLFRDYWQNGKGRNTKRENWTASWRTWCRKENLSSKSKTFTEKTHDENNRAIEEASKRYV